MSESLSEMLVRKFLADPGRVEALAWLRGGGPPERTLGVLSPDESLRLAQSIYDAGAIEVWAVDIGSYAIHNLESDVLRENSGKLVVRLPEEAATRKRLFAWEKRHARSLGLEGREDTGQTHLFVALD